MKMHLDSGHFLQSQARILAAWRFRRFAPKTDWKLIPGIMLAACTMCKQLTWWIRENPWDDRLTGHLADTELRAINLDGAGRCREQVSGNGSPILPGVVYTQGGLGIHREDWVSIPDPTDRDTKKSSSPSDFLRHACIDKATECRRAAPTSRKLLQLYLVEVVPTSNTHKTSCCFFCLSYGWRKKTKELKL